MPTMDAATLEKLRLVKSNHDIILKSIGFQALDEATKILFLDVGVILEAILDMMGNHK